MELITYVYSVISTSDDELFVLRWAENRIPCLLIGDCSFCMVRVYSYLI